MLISQQSNNFRFGKVLINFPTINQIIQTVSSTHFHKHEFTILENLKCKNTKSKCILCLCKSCIYRCIHFLNTCKYLAGEYTLRFWSQYQIKKSNPRSINQIFKRLFLHFRTREKPLQMRRNILKRTS